jgi:hypothetical protein
MVMGNYFSILHMLGPANGTAEAAGPKLPGHENLISEHATGP